MHKALTKTATLALLALTAFLAAGPATAFAGAEVATGGVPSAPQPAPVAQPVSHRGTLATWFGPGFYGRRTACGQILTPAVIGVAHRTLPCGTLVAVSYHGRRVTLPVIDRGPYAGNGAEWDLTLEAARALGITATARIATRVVGRTRNTPALGAPPVIPIQASTGGISAG
ncbi:MAG TPA: septal ring lytic transglycosylase RlpA family protein [Solirubrobacteraceae bacterium]|jgi:rare lipoprotein A (peptidoglycan hydrolase)|nr:septal ring lytic transglycosylase RlpA family protein [Solirubrobacteraceae bacterium]